MHEQLIIKTRQNVNGLASSLSHIPKATGTVMAAHAILDINSVRKVAIRPMNSKAMNALEPQRLEILSARDCAIPVPSIALP